MTNPVKRAVTIAGGPAETARKIGAKATQVSMWINRKYVPAPWPLALEEACNGEVPIHELNAEAYPFGRVRSMFRPSKRRAARAV